MKIAEYAYKDGPSVQVSGVFGVKEFIERWRESWQPLPAKKQEAGFQKVEEKDE